MEATIRQKKRRFLTMLMVVVLILPILAFAKDSTLSTDSENNCSGIAVGDLLSPGDTISLGGNATEIYIEYCDFDDETIEDDYKYNASIKLKEYDGKSSDKFGAWEITNIGAFSGGNYTHVKLKAVTTIKKIEITVTEPKVGAVCDYEFDATVSPDITFEPKVLWDYSDESSDYTYVNKGDKFKAGKLYIAEFYIHRDDNKSYITDETVVTVNGEALDFNDHYGNDVTDKGNWYKYDPAYAIIKVQYAFGPLVCDHSNTEVKDAVDPTCTKDGYSGDEYCVDCDELVKEGSTISAIPHVDENNDGICDVCSAELPSEEETPAETPATPADAEKTPGTGDSMNTIVLMAVAMTAVGAFAYTVAKKKEEL